MKSIDEWAVLVAIAAAGFVVAPATKAAENNPSIAGIWWANSYNPSVRSYALSRTWPGK